MKTAEVVKELAQLATKKGTSLVTFSNNKWSCEADLNTKDEGGLKSLANKSFTIVTPLGVYTRPSVTKPWTFKETPVKKKKETPVKKKKETPVKKEVKETAAERRARRKKDKAAKVTKKSTVANGKRSGKRSTAEVKTGMTQGAFIKEKILEGLSNKEVYEAMVKFFGEEIVTEKHKTHPAWYRCQMKKNGEL